MDKNTWQLYKERSNWNLQNIRKQLNDKIMRLTSILYTLQHQEKRKHLQIQKTNPTEKNKATQQNLRTKVMFICYQISRIKAFLCQDAFSEILTKHHSASVEVYINENWSFITDMTTLNDSDIIESLVVHSYDADLLETHSTTFN
ncbi:hypothetical protein RhiirA4_463985 [Rhizophagus irregularis]|uniref:Uncharacterized protein n=1 Tax=Rhizophagus irregularis TaxID=588596 RepID=A0A2I1GP59_9GLOM|nr:hypothetical protein RhiirA4_463985 [Rhizophagus irregularis]